jgi:hypothetical protein
MADATLPASIQVQRTMAGNTQYVGLWEDLYSAGLVPADWERPPALRAAGSRWETPDGRHCRLGRRVCNDPARTVVYCVTVHQTRDERRAQQEEQQRQEAAATEAKTARLKASGLIVCDYPPRFSCYIGTRAQIRGADVLPQGTAFPVAEDPEKSAKPWARWTVRGHTYVLCGRFRSQADKDANRWDGDHWELRVFDNRHELSDNLVEIRRAELRAAGQ